MRRAAAVLRRRVGKRGGSLLFFALVDLAYCYRLLFPSEYAREGSWFTFLAGLLPLWVWAIAWGGVGLLCLSRSWRHRDSGAFAFAISIKLLWAGLALASAAAGVDGWYLNLAVFLAFAWFVWNVASWPEPPPGRKERAWTGPTS